MKHENKSENKSKFQYIKPPLVLCVITTVMCGLLLFTNTLIPDTSGDIENIREDCIALMGEGAFTLVSDWEPTYGFDKPDNINRLIQKDDGSVAFEITAGGYNPPDGITALVAMNEDGSVKGVAIVEVKDTPGLGDKVKKPDFLERFKGVNKPVTATSRGDNPQDDGEVQGITGATYSSNGVAEAVSTAVETFAALQTGEPPPVPEKADKGILATLLVILISGVLTENFILAKFLGICPFLGVSKKLSGSVGMGLAVLVTMLLATLFTYPIFVFVLKPLNIVFMRTIVFILIIALFVQLLEMVIKKFIPPLYELLGMYLPLITTNCSILGVTLLNVNREQYNFGLAMFNSFCSGLGFLAVIVLFSTIRERIEHNDVPNALKGTPITLIAAAIMSLSLIGFSGLGNG